MLRVLANNKYTANPRADADMKRNFPALAKVKAAVLFIGGLDIGNCTNLSTVSRYNIETDIW